MSYQETDSFQTHVPHLNTFFTKSIIKYTYLYSHKPVLNALDMSASSITAQTTHLPRNSIYNLARPKLH